MQRRGLGTFAPLPHTCVASDEATAHWLPSAAFRIGKGSTLLTQRNLGWRWEIAGMENSGYPPEFVTPVGKTSASRCLDIGHLWLDGIDPLPYLRSALPRTRMIHLHGLKDGRDHQSIAHMPPQQLDAVLQMLVESAYRGIVTLEIFGQEDFESSMTALYGSLERISLE